MTAALRSYPAAVSLEAVAAAWVRRERAEAGSVVRLSHEVAGRLRGGTMWEPRTGTGVRIAVIARPALPAEHEALCWPAAVTAAALVASGTDGLIRSWWPDRLVGQSGQEYGSVNVTPILEPGRIAAVIVAARWDLDETAVDVGHFAHEVVRLLDVAGADPPALLAEHAEHSALFTQRVRATLLPRGEVRGEATELDQAGDLVLRSPSGLAQLVNVTQLNRLESI